MRIGDWTFVNAIVVVCQDDRVRHEKPFLSRAEAAKWAAWGHACTNRHRYDLTRVVMVIAEEAGGRNFYGVDADGEKFLISFDQCPETYGLREAEDGSWWTVVQHQLGQARGGDAHWLARDIAEKALNLYLEGAAFPIRSWHPAMGSQAVLA